MSDLGAAKGRILIDTKDVDRAVNEVRRGSELMTKALAAVGIGVGFEAIKRLGNMAFELAESAAQANRTRGAFDRLAAGVGQDANEMLAAMRTASRGMISDADLVLAANRAMLLGVADNTEKLTTLLDVARERGQAMGLSLSQAFNDLVTGLGRKSPLILDNLGIKGGQQALEAYAASIGKTAAQLTDAQQQAVLFNHILRTSKPLLDANANASDDAATKFEQMGVKIENSKQKLGDLLLAMGATDTLDTFGEAIDKSIAQLQAFDGWLQQLKTDWDAFSDSTGLSGALDALNTQLQRWNDFTGHIGFQIGTRSTDPWSKPNMTPNSGGGGGGGGFGSGRNGSSAPSSSGGFVPVPEATIDPAQVLRAQQDFARDLAAINRDAGKQILDAERDFGRQRAEAIRAYNLDIAREEEDFTRQRARQQRDYEAAIVRVIRDAQEREANIRADLDRQIGDARSEANKRLLKVDQDFAKQRERALRDHSDRLLDAAGRLDAKAIYEEQRNFARQQKDAEEAHEDQRKEIQESLQERIDQQRKAAERQLEEARKADRQRLDDMRAALEQQRADEDEDRAIRKSRAEEDFQHQLEQQDIEQGLRIQQIRDNAAEQRTALQQAFNDEMIALGLHNIAVETERKRAQDAELKAIEPFTKAWFGTIREAMEAAMAGQPIQGPPTQPSFRLDSFNTSRSAPMRTVHIDNVNISSAPNMSRTELHGLVVEAMVEALETAQ